MTLRAARPNFEEGLAYARLANEASEGFMRVFLGRNYEEILARAFVQPGHDGSYENATFAVQDTQIVGMSLAYSEARHRQSSLQPLRRAAGRVRLRMRVVETLLGPVMRLNDTIEAGDYYLQFIAVDRGGRGAGVGATLMEALEGQARADRALRLVLDVSKSNEAAQGFYLRQGWSAEAEWPERWFLPRLSVRMTKSL